MSRFAFNELTVTDPRWPATIATVDHDIYHLPEYAALEARRMGGRPLAGLVTWEGGMLLAPMVARAVDGEGEDLSSPYGYSGLLWSSGADAATIAEAAQHLFSGLSKAGYCSVFLRLHPILNHTTPTPLSDSIHVTGETVVINLDRPLDDIWHDVRKSELQQARRLRSLGAEARFEHGADKLEAFSEVYMETMLRVHASSDYFQFDARYYSDLNAILGDKLTLCTVWQGERLLSAKLFTLSSGIVQNLLGGTHTDAMSLQPSVLETVEAIIYFRAKGAKVLHLGGGLGGRRDSLFHFKAGFSHSVLPFRTLRWVLDAEAYQRRVVERARLLNVSVTELEGHGYFPVYRTPAP